MNFLEEETVVEENNAKALAVNANKTRVITASAHANHELLSQVSSTLASKQDGKGEIISQQDFFKQASLLVLAGMPLLSFVITVERLSQPEDTSTFKAGLKQDVFKLRQYLEHYQIPDDMVNKVCFLYAVAIDEAIIHCPWGETICWENHTLVGELFGYCNGGELFFEIVDEVLANSEENIQLIELVHLFLKLGYRGQYRNSTPTKINELIAECEKACTPYHQDRPLIGCSNIRQLKHKRIKHRHYYKSLFTLALLGCCYLLATQHYQHKQLAQQRLIAIEQQLSPSQPHLASLNPANSTATSNEQSSELSTKRLIQKEN
ncbi:type IVB secretion system protein IcmH/DotU [Thalassomonas sp. RHCl1]|uniref:type IVB secretion system protein IcmH/DotU n=1 Tax=Thalassomonas sp. RHCl1 TaxID=2995320 RepID=UPI00248BEDB2|nr:type IVB secretion system protein IcmH/DotU [Thalassomonas sp. RHCl1]